MKLSTRLCTRVATTAACAAAALLLTPAAARASIPPPDPAAGAVDSLPTRTVAQPPSSTPISSQDAVQMAVAMAIGAAVATAVRRRRPDQPDRIHSIVERVVDPLPLTGDVLVKD
jgi:hypothetical protein